MKNIHLQKTDKPSRLKQNKITKKISLVNKGIDLTSYTPINIYITSDEEIKEGDWFFRNNKIHQLRWDDGNGNLYTKNGLKIYKSSSKKIILTTDTDLITDGVQSIDDEFLQWYIQNPSCEWVNITTYGDYMSLHHSDSFHSVYKIIIPKEEPKQETLEEAAEKYCLINNIPTDQMIVKNDRSCEFETPITMFTHGAKWHQERMYSEEDLVHLLDFVSKEYNISNGIGWFHTHESIEDIPSIEVLGKWFEQFKNKKI